MQWIDEGGSAAGLPAPVIAQRKRRERTVWIAAGAASALVWAGLNTLIVEAVPANRAGATSVVSAFKFAGSAAAPAMWLPLYTRDVRLAFVAAGATSALVGALVLRLR